jgi:hypothetical protein
MAFEFCRNDATRESYIVIVLALFDCFSTENLQVVHLLTNMNSLPMVVTSINKPSFTSLIILENEISSGARPALPMGVAPEAILESIFPGIDSSTLFCFSLHPSRSCLFFSIISSGACPALPMVVAPEAIAEGLFPYCCLVFLVVCLSGALISTDDNSSTQGCY